MGENQDNTILENPIETNTNNSEFVLLKEKEANIVREFELINTQFQTEIQTSSLEQQIIEQKKQEFEQKKQEFEAKHIAIREQITVLESNPETANLDVLKTQIDELENIWLEFKSMKESFLQEIQDLRSQIVESSTSQTRSMGWDESVAWWPNTAQTDGVNWQEIGIIGNVRNWTKEKVWNARDWASENRWTVAKVGLGLWAWYLAFEWVKRVWSKIKSWRNGIKSFFGFGNSENNNAQNTENNQQNNNEQGGNNQQNRNKKWFWDRRYGQALKRTGIWTGVYFGYKRLTNSSRREWLWWKDENDGNNTEVNDAVGNTEEWVESFEEALSDPESKERAEQQNIFGWQVNDFYDYVNTRDGDTMPSYAPWTEQLWWWIDKHPWTVIHILQNTYWTIEEMTWQLSFFQIMANSSWHEIKEMAWDILNSRLFNFIARIFGYSDINWLIAWEDDKEDVQKLFQKMYKVVSYLSFAENSYLATKLEENVGNIFAINQIEDENWEIQTEQEDKITLPDQSDPDYFTKMSELVNKMKSNPNDYMIWWHTFDELRNEFRDQKPSDLPWLSISLDDIKNFNPNMTTNIDEINKNRDEQIKWLDNDIPWTMENMIENCEDQFGSAIKTAFETVPALNLLRWFGVLEDQTVYEQIAKSAWYQEMISKYKDRFEELKNSTNKDEIKKEIDNYNSALKELTTTAMWINASVDDDGNTVISWTNALNYMIWDTWDRMSYGIVMWKSGVDNLSEWEYREWTKDLFVSGFAIWWSIWSAVALWWTAIWVGKIFTWNISWWLSMIGKSRKTWAQLTVPLVSLPLKIGNWIATKYFKTRSLWAMVEELVPNHILSKTVYKSVEDLQDWIRLWLSIDDAYKIYKSKYWTNQADIPKDFLNKVMWISDGDFQNAMKNILFDTTDPQNIKISKDWDKVWMKKIRKNFIETKINPIKDNLLNVDEIFKKNIISLEGVRKSKSLNINTYRKLLANTNTKNYSDLVSVLNNDEIMRYLDNLDSKSLSNVTSEIWKKLKNWEIVNLEVLKNIEQSNLTPEQKALIQKLDEDIAKNNAEMKIREDEVKKIDEEIKIKQDDLAKQPRTWFTHNDAKIKELEAEIKQLENQKIAKKSDTLASFQKYWENLEKIKQWVSANNQIVSQIDSLLTKANTFEVRCKLVNALADDSSELMQILKQANSLDGAVDLWSGVSKSLKIVLWEIDSTWWLTKAFTNVNELKGIGEAIWKAIKAIL